MKKVDMKLGELKNEYNRLTASEEKKTFIKKYFGIDVNDDWSNLPGFRKDDGQPYRSGTISTSGSLDRGYVHGSSLVQNDSGIGLSFARYARMSFSV